MDRLCESPEGTFGGPRSHVCAGLGPYAKVPGWEQTSVLLVPEGSSGGACLVWRSSRLLYTLAVIPAHTLTPETHTLNGTKGWLLDFSQPP